MFPLRAWQSLLQHLSVRITPGRTVSSHRTDVPSCFCLHLDQTNPYFEVLIRDMRLYPDFVTEQEEQSLLAEVENDLKRRRYEFNHWDDAIHGFRELNRRAWNQTNDEILSRVKAVAFPPNANLIPEVHVLDLAEEGWIKPHVDSVRFCGNTISGLSLLSNSIMRLTLEEDKSLRCDVLLKRRSLYVMKDDVRFKFAHEILKNEESVFNGMKISKGRRISLIHRNQT